MKMFEGPTFSNEVIHSFAEARIKKKGLLKREPIELFEIGQPIMRVFRQIDFYNEDDEFVSIGIVDVELAPLVHVFEENLLLWRPLYVNLVQGNTPFDLSRNRLGHDKKTLETITNQLINARKAAQEELEEFKDEFAKVQSDWKSSSMSLLIPRSPSSLREQERLSRIKRAAEGIVKAVSLVINCSYDSRIKSAAIGDYVLVQTTLIRYISLVDDSIRILAIENPSAENIEDAFLKGRALARLLDINPTCQNFIMDRVFSSNFV
jgi:hypothetical protein